jgi:hypothetical protein
MGWDEMGWDEMGERARNIRVIDLLHNWYVTNVGLSRSLIILTKEMQLLLSIRAERTHE